jgi:hypothetical protein
MRGAFSFIKTPQMEMRGVAAERARRSAATPRRILSNDPSYLRMASCSAASGASTLTWT